VLALFIIIGGSLGNMQVASRIAGNERVQEQLLERYKTEHAEEIAEAQREAEAYAKRTGRTPGAVAKPIDPTAPTPPPDPNAAADDDDDDTAQPAAPGAGLSAMRGEPAPKVTPYGGLTREEVLDQFHPELGDPLWFKILPFSFWLVMAGISLILPSAAIVIAQEDRFFAALNPLRVLDFIKSMGSAYFALWVLFLLIAGTRQVAMRMGENWPAAVRFPLEMGIATYLGLVLFAMMGYALYQFHQELGLDVSVDFDSHRKAGGAEGIAQAGSARAALQAQEPKDPLERKLQALLAEGNVKEAIAEVKDHMRYDRLDPALNTRLHSLYMQQGDAAVTLTHGQQWLSGLAKTGKGADALRALQALLKLDPKFAVQDGDVVLPAATAAYQKGEFPIALNLVRAFDKRYPKHKDTPGVLFLGAKLASEHLRQQETAVKILGMITAHFPNDPVAVEAKTYLAVLNSVLTKVQGAPK
ncbi:MAG: hypothetical protein HY255_11160, partial [Betaproteobacteria bacterium]|nr:hypothetical protein [Betaproteobacteria bacterium]